MKVVEKNEPEKEKYVSPRNIVAKKESNDYENVCAKGQPMAAIHDHVEKGQLLVSGLIGSEDHQQEVASKAEIYGEAWYRSEVTVPLETLFNVYTGKVRTKHKLSFGSLAIPIWGMTFKKEELKHPKTEQEKHSLHFLGFKLLYPMSKSKQEKVKRLCENIRKKKQFKKALNWVNRM